METDQEFVKNFYPACYVVAIKNIHLLCQIKNLEKMKPKVLSPEENGTSCDTRLGIPPLLNEGARSHLRFSSTFQGSLLIPYFPPTVCILSSNRRCLPWVHLCRGALYSWKPGQACNSQEEAGEEVLLL